jgi:hypothetical protein
MIISWGKNARRTVPRLMTKQKPQLSSSPPCNNTFQLPHRPPQSFILLNVICFSVSASSSYLQIQSIRVVEFQINLLKEIQYANIS